jgi:hypothetical protein
MSDAICMFERMSGAAASACDHSATHKIVVPAALLSDKIAAAALRPVCGETAWIKLSGPSAARNRRQGNPA